MTLKSKKPFKAKIKKKDLSVDEGFICRHRLNIKEKVTILQLNVLKNPNMIFLYSNLKKKSSSRKISQIMEIDVDADFWII